MLRDSPQAAVALLCIDSGLLRQFQTCFRAASAIRAPSPSCAYSLRAGFPYLSAIVASTCSERFDEQRGGRKPDFPNRDKNQAYRRACHSSVSRQEWMRDASRDSEDEDQRALLLSSSSGQSLSRRLVSGVTFWLHFILDRLHLRLGTFLFAGRSSRTTPSAAGSFLVCDIIVSPSAYNCGGLNLFVYLVRIFQRLVDGRGQVGR